ncbi:MAG: CPBP family intramembrane metalloprotease [Candidatus Heimdallarchaeota archaeon]|nr:CPBP family intramembrane metalloprotease [Candidatus Heimdallarchaeota archaeon]
MLQPQSNELKSLQITENEESRIMSHSHSGRKRSWLSFVSQNFLIKTLLGFIFVLLVQVTSKEIIIKPVLSLLPIPEGIKLTIQFSLAIFVILLSYKFFVKYYEKRDCTELSPGMMKRDSGIGFLSGFISISLIFGILSTLGYYSIGSYNWDFPFIEVFVLILALALIEEILFRGFFYRFMEESVGTNLAIIVSAIFFGFSHIFNDHVNFVSIMSATFGGLLLSVMYSYRRSLWLPISFHAFWNYSQIIYGSDVSGDGYGTFVTANLNGPELMTGNEFGIENSILVLLVVLAATVILYIKLYRSKGLKVPYWKKPSKSNINLMSN